MADIKTMTEEITELSVSIRDSIMGGESEDMESVLNAIVEKLDEIINKIN
tara:strand:- start:45 stop:194 length:150 start_codon:yes stop_codon:yes gene_type:complete